MEQSVRNENIDQIRQSQEIGPDNQQSNVKNIGSSTLLAGTKSGKNDENQPENDAEKYLMSKKVYQNTTEPVNQRSSKCGSVNCRTVLWYVAFVGFMMNYMYRVNINIAIVEMVSIKKTTVSNDHTSECLAHQIFESPVNATLTSNVNTIRNFVFLFLFFTLFYHFKRFIFFSIQKQKLDFDDQKTTFAWNELEQNRILGAFFWLHWTTQILGGIFAARYGTKLIFGLSNFLSSFLCIFIPIAASWDINYLIALRIIQGTIGVIISFFCSFTPFKTK